MQNPQDYDRERLEREQRAAGEPEQRNVGREPGPTGPEYRGVRYGYVGGELALTDMVRWGPIIAGFAATMAVLILMSVLGAAIGATAVAPGETMVSTTFGAIWGALSLIVAFFVGGWLAARTAGIGGQMTAIVNSGLVWAFTLLFLLFMAALGVAGLAPIVGDLFTPGALAVDPSVAWWSLVALLLGLAAAIAGGLVGMHREPEPSIRD